MYSAYLRSIFLFLSSNLLWGPSVLTGQAQAGIVFKMSDNDQPTWVVEVKLDSGQTMTADKLNIYLATEWQTKHRKGQKIAGQQSKRADNLLVFQPILPFSEGLTYVATYPGFNTVTFTIPTPKYTPTTIVGIYPNCDTIPENILKMYLHFSAKMSVGKSYANLCITNEVGDTIPQPFLHLDPELWNETGRRLTLWYDPGRVKRDLVPNQLMGAPLKKGHTYTLHINPKWTDAAGHPLAQAFKQSFYVGEADRSQPRPSEWEINAPLVQSMQPLVLRWKAPLDEALLHRSLSVWNPKGQVISGKIELGPSQMSWSFFPHSNWEKGTYKIRIHSKLEDLAGNNLNRPFDRDLDNAPGEIPDTPFHWLSFEVK